MNDVQTSTHRAPLRRIDLSAAGKQEEPRESIPQMSLSESVEAFRDEARAFGLEIDSIQPDGEVHKVRTAAKQGRKNGWYILNVLTSGSVVGYYGDFQQSEKGQEWKSWDRDGSLDSAALEKLNRELELYKLEQQRKRNEKQIEQAEWSSNYYNSLNDCPSTHPYLMRKRVPACEGLRIDNERNCIVMPLFAIEEHQDGTRSECMIAHQKIYADKITTKSGDVTDKTTHGVISNGQYKPYFSIEGNIDTIFICEGYSTAATVHEATGCTVYIALFAGRLSTIGNVVRDLYPNSRIVFAADNDCENKKNTGVVSARRAAEEIGAEVVVPELSGKKCDWNDVYIENGLEMVRVQMGFSTDSQYGSINARDILKREYPHNPLVEGLIDEGESFTLVGDSNVGKSIITLNIAAALGNPMLDKWDEPDHGLGPRPKLFGHFPVMRRVNTLIVQDENSGKSLQRRLEYMLSKNKQVQAAVNAGSLFFFSQNGEPSASGGFSVPEFMQRLRIEIIRTKAALVIIDPFSSYFEGEENDNGEMLKILNSYIKPLMRELNVSVMFIHHTGKDKTRGARGASALRGWLDTQIIVTKVEVTEERDHILRMDYDKSRNFETDPSKFYIARKPDLTIEPEYDYVEGSAKDDKKNSTVPIISEELQVPRNIIASIGMEFTGAKKFEDEIRKRTGCTGRRAREIIQESIEQKLISMRHDVDRNCYVFELPEKQPPHRKTNKQGKIDFNKKY